jgi:AcrR family transcriptional regulator
MARPKKLSDSEVLHVAYDVSSREGFDSFTLRQVARSADLSPAALIKRFKSKTRLATLARHHRWDSNLGEFHESSSTRPLGLNGVRRFVALIAKSVDSKRLAEHARSFGLEANNTTSRKNVAAYFAKTREIFSRLLREAMVNNELVGVQNCEELAFTLEALVQGAIFQFAFLGERNIELHLQNHITQLLKPYLVASAD